MQEVAADKNAKPPFNNPISSVNAETTSLQIASISALGKNVDKYDVFIGGRWGFLDGNWSAGTSVTMPSTIRIAKAYPRADART